MLKFPINVLEYYPTGNKQKIRITGFEQMFIVLCFLGTFPIRYKLFDEEEEEIACFHFTIKIF